MKISQAVAMSLLSVLLSISSAFAAKVGTVSGNNIALYENPDKGSNNISTLNNGDVVTISNIPTKGFYKVRTENGQMGWIDSNSLLVGEATQGTELDATQIVAAAPGQSTPANPGAAQVNSPPANQNPQSADNLIPAPPSTPAPVDHPKEEIPEVPSTQPVGQPAPTDTSQNPPPPEENGTSTIAQEPPPPAENVPPPAPQEAAPLSGQATTPPQNTAETSTATAPVQNLGSSTFTYEDVQPGLNYEIENHRNGPRSAEHHYSGRKSFNFNAFAGVDSVSMKDMNSLLGSSIFTSMSYFGGEFGYALNDEMKIIGRVEYLTKSSSGGTADLNLSSNPVMVGVGFQLGRWSFVHFYLAGLVGIGFNTQITATASNLPQPNQTTLSESTFTEMVKLDAAIPIYKSVGLFLEGGYRFLKTSSLSPSTAQIVNGTNVFANNNGTYPYTALDLSGPFFGGGLSFQF